MQLRGWSELATSIVQLLLIEQWKQLLLKVGIILVVIVQFVESLEEESTKLRESEKQESFGNQLPKCFSSIGVSIERIFCRMIFDNFVFGLVHFVLEV